MENQDRWQIMQNYVSKEKAKGVKDEKILEKLIENGITRREAKYIVETTEAITILMDQRVLRKLLFWGIFGLAAFIIGLGITLYSKWQIIAYGAIITGPLMILRAIVIYINYRKLSRKTRFRKK